MMAEPPGTRKKWALSSRSIRSMTSPAFSTGKARMTRKALTKIIQEKSGNRRSVMCGARLQRTVAMKLILAPTEPMPRTRSESAQ